jgi:hypothetical protein
MLDDKGRSNTRVEHKVRRPYAGCTCFGKNKMTGRIVADPRS